jgi:predicted phosphoribosyltransferase
LATDRQPEQLPFRDREQAGRRLGALLADRLQAHDALVLGLPRGGVPVAYEVARALHAPLDVLIVRKVGAPGQRELAMGAVASGGTLVVNRDVVAVHELSEETVLAAAESERRALESQERALRGDRPAPEVAERTIVLVDDGLATGSTMRAAVRAMRQRGAGAIVVAVPVAPPATCALLEQEADVVACLATPEPFRAVGVWYADFEQTTDREVRELLARAASNA